MDITLGQIDLVIMKNKIILTGPECSGKTTLCNQLKMYCKLPANKEFARSYLGKLNRKYVKKDLIFIAKKQLESERNKVLLDTDLITIKIWSEYKYNQCNPWIIEQIAQQRSENRLYLVCKPDIPWEADSLRENPSNRAELFEIYLSEIQNTKHPYFIIEGEERLEKALSKIQSFSI